MDRMASYPLSREMIKKGTCFGMRVWSTPAQKANAKSAAFFAD